MLTQAWKLLIIDDSEMDFLIYSSMLTHLEEPHFNIHWAKSFQEGLDLLLTETWDAALIDYFLDHHTGIDLIRKVRAEKIMIPLVLLTASEERSVDLDAMRTGVDGFLSKENLRPILIERTLRYARAYRQNQVQVAQLNDELEQKIIQRTQELIGTNYALQESEQRAQLLKEIASIANAMPTVEAVLTQALEKISTYTGWPVGHIYFHQEQIGKRLDHLFSSNLWHFADVNTYEHFAGEVFLQNLLPWEGLPGRVYCFRSPYWYDFNDDLGMVGVSGRLDQAKAYGLRSHLGFPIIVENEVVAVLEFFSLTDEKPAAQLLNLMAQIGQELGYVSKRKRIEAELQKAHLAAEAANHSKSVFLASMSHEIRTPMNAILGTAQLMQRFGYENPKHEKYLKTILRSGEHLLTLINEILEMTKIEAGLMPINLSDFDVRYFIEDLRLLFQEQLRRLPEVKLVIDISETVPAVIHTDAGKVRQIILNLVGNAFKFTQQGSIIIELSCQLSSPHEGVLKVSVHDTGSGIEAKEMNKLFKSFEQTSSGRAQSGGTGLGLALCEKYANLLKGNMFVSSEWGMGSTFGFTLPVAISEAQPITTHIKIEQQILSLAPEEIPWRILVIDDEATNREIVLDFLSPLGFQLKEAPSAADGLALIKAWSPQLVLLDLSMPVMNGLELTHLLRQQSQFKELKIIILTANAFEEDRIAALEAGANDFLSKPFQANRLFEILANHLGLKYIYAKASEPACLEGEALFHLQELPQALLQSMQQATLEGDLDLLLELTAQLTDYNPLLFDVLQKAAGDYDYQKIADTLEISL